MTASFLLPLSPQVQCWVEINARQRQETCNGIFHHSTLKRGEEVGQFSAPSLLHVFLPWRRQITEFVPRVLSGSV